MKATGIRTIKIDRVITDLDKFVFGFLDILKKYSDYVIVNGYVAILLGRAREIEEVDVLIPKISEEAFSGMYDELLNNEYWFLDFSNFVDLFELLNEKSSVRIARTNNVIPNIRLSFLKNRFDKESFSKKILATVSKKEVFIPQLELQIAYKRAVLKSDKDLEDAEYLETLFSNSLDKNLIDRYIDEMER